MQCVCVRACACARAWSEGPSEGPRHYTLLDVENGAEGEPPSVVFKDSLKGGASPARAAATRLLRQLGYAGPTDEAPAPSNEAWQTDGWSCGLWCTIWLERALRERRGEARTPPPSLAEQERRGNDFISRIRDAVPPTPRAKAKAKAPRKGADGTGEDKEPKFETLEEALRTGLKCSKCLATQQGTKGCRGCMGEWFEHIRLKAYPRTSGLL